MTTFQMWLIVGLPGLVVVGALFTGRSPVRAALGYLALAALLIAFVVGTGDIYSSAAVGLIGFFLVASGRGTASELEPQEHENRKRYTTTPSHS